MVSLIIQTSLPPSICIILYPCSTMYSVMVEIEAKTISLMASCISLEERKSTC